MLGFKKYLLEESVRIADQVRNLTEQIDNNNLGNALLDFVDAVPSNQWVLIGGLAIGFHTRPRATQDIDILCQDSGSINPVEKFKKHRAHAIEHKQTGVEIELLDAAFLKINPQLVQKVLETAVSQTFYGRAIRVPSASGLVALKLQRAATKHPSALQDMTDVCNLIRHNAIDLVSFPLTPEHIATFNQCLERVRGEEPGPAELERLQ